MEKTVSLRKVLLLIALTFTVLASGCGGGGGGGGSASTADSGTAYTGKTTQTTITQGNAQTLTVAGSNLGQLSSIVGSAGSGAPRFFHSLGFVAQAAVASLAPTTVTGNCGGTSVSDTTYDSVTSKITNTTTYTNYCQNATTTNGQMTFSGTFGQATLVMDVTVTFTNYSTKDATSDNLMNGTATLKGTLTNGSINPVSITMNVDTKDNLANKTLKMENVVETSSTSTTDDELTISSGRIYHPDYGYFDVSSPTPMRTSIGDAHPSSGVFVITGANNATAKLTYLSKTQYKVEVDETGSGTYVLVGIYDWPGAVTVAVSAIATGDGHSMALKSDGTVWTWGWNSDGQLGDGTNTDRYTPVQVGLTGVTDISAGGNHTVVLKSDGTVWTWGKNLTGQLGDGTYTSNNTPVQVSGLTGVTAIAAGSDFTMALKSDGTVWVWGNNFAGIIGNWTDYPAGKWNIPVQVSVLGNVTAIAAGWEHALALENDGSVWTWGFNGSGQLGGGTAILNSMRYDPQNVLTGVAAIAAGGGSSNNRHSIVIKSDGTAWTFGYNSDGELGNGTTTASPTPVQVSGLTSITAVAAGSNFTTALKSDGTVWTWGYNIDGQLGDGSLVEKLTPVQVNGLTGVAKLVTGGYHSLVLKNDGTVWGWGGNGNGELGDGTTATAVNTPVQVTGL